MSMKKNIKKMYSFVTVMAFALALAFPIIGTSPEVVHAQMCNPGQTSGNLGGYAYSPHIGNIYMSTEAWNEHESSETTVSFSVSYDTQLQVWTGRGWNPYVGWIDFGGENTILTWYRQAQMESVVTDPSAWGYMNSIIDLSEVVYSTNAGSFVGYGTHGDFTIDGGTITTDTPVGAQLIDFSNVILDLDPGDCHERVDVLLNGQPVIYRQVCPIPAPLIQWASQDVTNCTATQGLWTGDKGPSGEEFASGSITGTNTPVTFRLSCTGVGSGATVYGEAYASCGEGSGPGDPGEPGGGGPGGGGPGGGGTIDPTTGVIIPDFREV